MFLDEYVMPAQWSLQDWVNYIASEEEITPEIEKYWDEYPNKMMVFLLVHALWTK